MFRKTIARFQFEAEKAKRVAEGGGRKKDKKKEEVKQGEDEEEDIDARMDRVIRDAEEGDEDYDGFGDDLLGLGGGEGGLLNMPSVLSEGTDGGRAGAETRPTTATTATYALPSRAMPSVRPGTPVWVPGTQSWRGSSQRSPERASSRTYRAASRKDVVAALDAGTHRAIPKALGSRTKTMLRCWQARRCRCG